MTQYTEMVKLHALKMDAEKWGKQVNSIYVENGITQFYYNNGNIKYQDKDKVWWEYNDKFEENIVNDYSKAQVDWRSGNKNDNIC